MSITSLDSTLQSHIGPLENLLDGHLQLLANNPVRDRKAQPTTSFYTFSPSRRYSAAGGLSW